MADPVVEAGSVLCTMPSMLRWCWVALCAVLAGCAPPALAGSFESPEALASAVLSRLEARDETGLLALAVNEAEFRERVWPELPASRPDRNLPFGYVWTDLRTKSLGSLRGVLAEHGGRRYSVVAVRAAGGMTQYDTYLVHRETVIDARGPDGTVQSLQLFGSMIEARRRGSQSTT